MFLTTTAVEITSSPSSPMTVPSPADSTLRLGDAKGVLSFEKGSC